MSKMEYNNKSKEFIHENNFQKIGSDPTKL